MEKKELVCIGCPMGCPVTVTMEGNKIMDITGNTCPRGRTYAEKEVTNPTRIVTSTVRVAGGDRPFISVKTKEDIPREKIFDCMQEINGITVKAPVKIGDVVLKNAAGTGVPVIATKAAAVV